jgi:hypothetical protein
VLNILDYEKKSNHDFKNRVCKSDCLNFVSWFVWFSAGPAARHHWKSCHMYCTLYWSLFGAHWDGALLSPWGRCSIGWGFHL